MESENDYIREWLAYSLEEIESSKMDFKHKRYRKSLISFQFGLELLSKAIFIHRGIINSGNEKSINHYPHKVFIDKLKDSHKRIIRQSNDEYLVQILDNINIDINEINDSQEFSLNVMNNYTQDNNIVLGINKKEFSQLKKIITSLDDLSDLKLKMFNREKLFDNAMKLINKGFDFENNDEIKLEVEKELKKVISELDDSDLLKNMNSIFSNIRIDIWLFVLIIFFTPCFNLRYPNDPKSFLKKFQINDNILVKNMKFFYSLYYKVYNVFLNLVEL